MPATSAWYDAFSCFYTVNDQQLLRHEMVNFLVTPVEGSSER